MKFVSKDSLDRRAETIGEYIVEHKATIRAAAEYFGMSKSTVYHDVSVKLKASNEELYKEVCKVLKFNESQRHIRGGAATKIRWKSMKNS